uniref:Integrase, catalytic region, zinc finger, CCHC-type, peptidase aspartic, catalytic n=1 Tax=Tanacetum cinerariifolium TaxID=118510 RepID=A0A6L2L190_TANCI|nr:hypothetical protein [Tanacetum cinerariifolium]
MVPEQGSNSFKSLAVMAITEDENASKSSATGHKDDQVFQLLASLGPDFEELKRHILLNAELPNLKSVCHYPTRINSSKIMINDVTTQEARVYSANASLDMKPYKGKHSDLKCGHCNVHGHSMDHFWILHPQLKPKFTKDKKGFVDKRHATNPKAHMATHTTDLFSSNPVALLNEFANYLQEKHGQGAIQDETTSQGLNEPAALLSKFSSFLSNLNCESSHDIFLAFMYALEFSNLHDFWIVDSGAIDHISNKLTNVSDFIPFLNPSFVSVAEGCSCNGNGAHYGYNCSLKVPIIPDPKPFNNQTIKELPQTFPSFDPTCYSEDGNSFTYNSTSNLVHDSPNVFNLPSQPTFYSCKFCWNDARYGHYLKFCLSIRNRVTINTLISRKIFLIFNNNIFVVKIAGLLVKLTNKIPAYYDDDDDDYTIAITHKEPGNSLSMGDEHLDTIPATESDEFIKSSVENLVPNPSESEGEHEYDVPACEVFTTFSNILFDADYDFSFSDDQSFSDEDIPKKIYSNPLFDEEIISMKIDLHHFNVESDLIESLLNHDSSITSSLKIDSLFDEFAGELTLLKLILPGIDKTDCDLEEETHFIKRLLYDNSSPRPPKEFVFENSVRIKKLMLKTQSPCENIQCVGSDTRPPMLDRTDFASWQQRIRLYYRGKENGVNILKSIDEGTYQLGKVRETLAESTEGAPQFGPKRSRVYSDLTSKEKDWYNANIRATNILLQGLPKDIYTLINHYADAKDIWDNVKMLLEGSELTKEDRESQLYNDFEHFRLYKGESIHDYYVRFTKLINDMRNIKMTMSRLQLNSKFVNNMLPEWGRFVMAVKLNRGLRDSNYDQLYAYLKQHETRAKENKMMLERFSQPIVDHLALLSNVSHPQYYSPSSSASSSTQVPPPLADLSSPAEDLIENLTNTMALLTQSYRTFLPQTNNQLRTSFNARNQATIQEGRVVVQNGQARSGQARTVKCYNCNGTCHITQNCTQPNRPQNSEYYKDKMLLMQAQENEVALDAEQLLFLAGGQDKAFNDDAPTTQTMIMANLSSADPVTDKVGPSYDSDILSKVPDHELYQDAACAHHEGHVMYDSAQLDLVVDSHADYTINSNMILYDQYVKDNEVPVVHSDASSVPTDAFMMIYNDMCESYDQSVSNPSRNTVVKKSLTAKLATYKEHVELYEQRAKFELNEREQKINEQLRLVISDRNFKEETLKRKLHSIKLQLASTINHNKSMVEEVSFLKKDFKQKERKYLEDFLDMKSLKEKVEDKLIKQDQSRQTVHMLCRPRPHYNELNKVAIGYKNPLCLTRAKQIQPALYNGHEIIKDNHTPTIVHNAEDTLEIAEITRKKMNAKMNDPECVTRKVKIAPRDYSKENFLATFTLQKQLTLEQIFWSNDLMKLKSKALKERTKVSRPIKAFTVYPPNTPAMLVPKVIPFFKTLKDNFEGIQKALTKEIKEMKDVLEELEAVVAQYAVDRKHDAIKRKNLLIANDKLIAKCLSQEVFSVATNYEQNVARFTAIHVANTTVEARCLALKAELANLRNTNNHDNQKELINHFSKLKVNHLNLQLKYQNLKDSIGNNPPTPDKDTLDFDSVFVIGKMQASLHGKDNVIRQLKKQLSQLQVTHSDTDCTLQVQTIDSQITKLTDQVTHLQAQNDLFRAKNDKVKQHYKELYDSIKITRAKHIEQVTKLTTDNMNLKTSVNKNQVKPPVLVQEKHAIDVEPIVPRLRNNRDAHLDYLMHLKESVETIRDIVEEVKLVRPLDRSIVSACRYTKHSQELLEYAIGTYP